MSIPGNSRRRGSRLLTTNQLVFSSHPSSRLIIGEGCAPSLLQFALLDESRVTMRCRLAHLLTAAMEGVVLLLVPCAVWPFGSVHAYFQWLLIVGVGLLLVLWAARTLVEGRLVWVSCPIALGLATLCLLVIVQVIPLSAGAVGILAPGTASLRGALLPAAPEPVDGGSLTTSSVPAATLSLDAGATRDGLLQLVAVVALFAAVRNNLRYPAFFYRLAWVCAANGVALALVGMGQLASSPSNVVFWSVPTRGAVFGPFICRNHFAYYANLCLGLTAGLLLGTRYFQGLATEVRRPDREPQLAWREMFRDPRVLWLAACLAIVGAGLVASLSRGGILGLIAGGGTAVVMLMARRATLRWAMLAGTVSLSLLLACWFGFDRVSHRWQNIWHDNVAAESRVAVWQRTLPLTARFAVWGSGLGTFERVEQLTRVPGDSWNVLHDHAHSDFLELWIEGGTIQLLIALVIIGLVVHRGARAFSRHASNSMGFLALGGLAGFIAVVVQSFVDFGLHIPAVAVLTAVVAASLANLAETPPTDALPATPEPRPQGWGFPVALLQAALLAAVALFLVSTAHRAEQAERFRLASRAVTADRRVDYLKAAVALAPERVELRLSLVDALLRRADASASRSRAIMPLTLGPTPSVPGLAAVLALTNGIPGPVFQDGTDLREAKTQALIARQLSPLQFDAQEVCLRLGVESDGPERALDRLLLLSPSMPEPWLQAGRLALGRGDRSKAYVCWRNALRANEGLLAEIGRAVPHEISPRELLDQVLPPNPAMIFDVVAKGAVQGLSSEDERRFCRAALALLAEKGEKRIAEDFLLEARIHTRLDDVDAAINAYRAALAKKPRAPAWRLELCQLLYRTGNYAEARRELILLRSEAPANSQVNDLYHQVLRAEQQ
jgi:tetratricopeptide (TPR) repeat protein